MPSDPAPLREELFGYAVGRWAALNEARVRPWERRENRTAIAFMNRAFTLEQRLAKFREEALEAALEVTRQLDHPEQMRHYGRPNGNTLAELADVIVTLDSLLSRPDVGKHLLDAVERAYGRLRERIVAGEFG